MEEIEEKEEQTLWMLSERVSKGRTYAEVCEELGVGWTELLRWLQAKEERWLVYLKAHEARAINHVDEAIRIADGAVEGSGEDPGNVQSSKLRIDTRFKAAAAYAPGLFGKKVQHEHSAVGDLGERLRRARERVVEQERPALEGKVEVTEAVVVEERVRSDVGE